MCLASAFQLNDQIQWRFVLLAVKTPGDPTHSMMLTAKTQNTLLLKDRTCGPKNRKDPGDPQPDTDLANIRIQLTAPSRTIPNILHLAITQENQEMYIKNDVLAA